MGWTNPVVNRKAGEVQVTVEYTARGKRTTKTFPNMFAARSFYAAKYEAGAAPRIVSSK